MFCPFLVLYLIKLVKAGPCFIYVVQKIKKWGKKNWQLDYVLRPYLEPEVNVMKTESENLLQRF